MAYDITDKLAERLPELLDYDRISYLYKAKGEDEDIPRFWQNALEVYCSDRYSFCVAEVVSAFTVSFTERDSFGGILSSTSVEPMTFEKALSKLMSSEAGVNPHFRTRSDFAQEMKATSAPKETASDTESGIWASLVNALSPMKSDSPSSSSSDASTIYIHTKALQRLQGMVCHFAYSADFEEIYKNQTVDIHVRTCAQVMHSSAPGTQSDSAASRWSFNSLLHHLLKREQEKNDKLKLNSVDAEGGSQTAAYDDVLLLEGLLGNGDEGILLQYMRQTGAVTSSSANPLIIKVHQTPKNDQRSDKKGKLGFLSFFGSSPESGVASAVEGEVVITDAEVAAFEIATQIQSFEAILDKIETEIASREQRAKTFFDLSKTKQTAASRGAGEAPDRFKKQALHQLRQKRDLQDRYTVVSNSLAKIEGVASKLSDTAVHIEVLEAMRTGTKILKSVNAEQEKLADSVDDVILDFEEMQVSTTEMSNALKGGDNIEEDDELLAEFEQIGEMPPSPAAVATAAAAAAAAATATSTMPSQSSVNMPVAPDGVVLVPSPATAEVSNVAV